MIMCVYCTHMCRKFLPVTDGADSMTSEGTVQRQHLDSHVKNPAN